MSREKIHLLFSCDMYKDKESMRLIYAGLSDEKMRNVIMNEIRHGRMCYYDKDMSVKEQISKFETDWENGDAYYKDHLICGIYDFTNEDYML